MADSTPAAPDTRTIAAAAAGNMGAFAQLVRTYRERVVRTACGILGSSAEAEDVAQEVFIKVWNKLPQYRGQEGTFSSWLYRIATNTAIDLLRHRRHEVLMEDLPEDARGAGQAMAEERVLQRSSRDQVRRAIQTLPPAARTVLVLREYEELSYKEIAEILQIPMGTVMSRLNYARQTLRKKLLEEE